MAKRKKDDAEESVEFQRIAMVSSLIGKTTTEMAKEMNINPQRFYDIRAAKAHISTEVKNLLTEYYSVNPVWLMSGKGDIFMPKQPPLSELERRLLCIHEDYIQALKQKDEQISKLISIIESLNIH